MITFKEDIRLTIVEEFDEERDNIDKESTETFRKGEFVDADIVDKDNEYVTLQFADGSVAYGVQRESFTVVNKE